MDHSNMDHSSHHMEPANHEHHSNHMTPGQHGLSHSMDINNMLNSSSPAHHVLSNGTLQEHHTRSHSSHQHSEMGMMSMTFHGGYLETILFSWWKVTEVGEFVGSFFAIFIMALLYEGLKYYRKHLLWKTYTGLQYCAVSPPDKGVANICAPDEPQVIQPTVSILYEALQGSRRDHASPNVDLRALRSAVGDRIETVGLKPTKLQARTACP